MLLWHEDDDVTNTEPFAGIEVKKTNGIDARAKGQVIREAKRYGNVILTDNLVWRCYHAEGDDAKEYTGVQLIEMKNGALALREDSFELFSCLIADFLLKSPAQIRSSSRLAEYMANHAKTIRIPTRRACDKSRTRSPLPPCRRTPACACSFAPETASPAMWACIWATGALLRATTSGSAPTGL